MAGLSAAVVITPLLVGICSWDSYDAVTVALASDVLTSTLIMTAVAFVGTVSHVTMGAEIYPSPMALVVLTCLLGARSAALFANKCDIEKLNCVIGCVLLILGAVTICSKVNG